MSSFNKTPKLYFFLFADIDISGKNSYNITGQKEAVI